MNPVDGALRVLSGAKTYGVRQGGAWNLASEERRNRKRTKNDCRGREEAPGPVLPC